MTSQTENQTDNPEIPAALAVQLSRASTAKLRAPAPNDADLTLILAAATTVPDHGQLVPWRLVVVRDDARRVFGDALAAAGAEALGPDARTDKLRSKATLAPLLVVLVASPTEDAKVPVWEQVTSASCTGYAIALAAHALGYGAVWKTSNFLDGTALREALDLQPGERVLGWVNLGTGPDRAGPEHRRPALADVVTELDATTGRPRRYSGPPAP